MENTSQVNNTLAHLKMNVCKGVKSKVFLWQEKVFEAKNSHLHLIFDGSKKIKTSKKTYSKSVIIPVLFCNCQDTVFKSYTWEYYMYKASLSIRKVLKKFYKNIILQGILNRMFIRRKNDIQSLYIS